VTALTLLSVGALAAPAAAAPHPPKQPPAPKVQGAPPAALPGGASHKQPPAPQGPPPLIPAAPAHGNKAKPKNVASGSGQNAPQAAHSPKQAEGSRQPQGTAVPAAKKAAAEREAKAALRKAEREAKKTLKLTAKNGETPSAPAAPAPASAAASTPTSTPTTPSTPTPAATPAASTATPPTHATTAGATRTTPRTGAASRRTSARGAHARAGALARPLPGTPAAGTVAAAAAGDPGAGTPRAAHEGTSAGDEPANARQSLPAIRTIERLVGVIPRWIWTAMGVLAVLSLVLSGGSMSAFARARRVERQRRRLAADVGLLQGALLPAVPELIGGAHTSAAYRPAEGPAAGGDFYDVWELSDGRVALMVGDVSGHGRAALPQTALIRYTLRAYLDAGMAPRKALGAGAAALERQLQASFATVVLAVYDPRENTLTYSCAGHPPPIVLGTRSVEPVLECCSPPVGTGSPTGLRETTVRLPGRAQVCFFTDGVVEARADGDLFGVERLTVALAELGVAASAQDVLDAVVARSDRRPDDMAACLLSVPGGEHAPWLRNEELELRGDHLDVQGPRQLLAACGVDAVAIHAAIRQVRATVARDGGAVLRVRLGGPVPAVDVAAAEAHPAPHDQDDAEQALAG
jgi:hypothetical protein